MGSLCEAYADQPCSAAGDALITAVQRAMATEIFPSEAIECDVDFGAACTAGAQYIP